MIIITRTTICTECTETRARRIAEALQRKGYDAQYGDVSQLPSSKQFNEDFYTAIDKVDYGYGVKQ